MSYALKHLFCHKSRERRSTLLENIYYNLNKLKGASDNNLKLFEVDVLDYDALWLATEGCMGVAHVTPAIPILLCSENTHGENTVETLKTY